MKRCFTGICAATTILLTNCGSAGDTTTGRCKQSSGGKYVAASTDSDGKKWAISVSPPAFIADCSVASEKKAQAFTARIQDGQGNAKAGLAVKAMVSGGGIQINDEESAGCITNDTVTDTCGIAIFCVQYTCPQKPAQKNAGVMTIMSGPLASEPVTIAITYPADAQTQSGAPAK